VGLGPVRPGTALPGQGKRRPAEVSVVDIRPAAVVDTVAADVHPVAVGGTVAVADVHPAAAGSLVVVVVEIGRAGVLGCIVLHRSRQFMSFR